MACHNFSFHLPLLNNYMGQRVSGQASTLLAGQEILHLKLNPKVQQHIRKNTPLEPFLSQLGADYILTPNLCIICTH